MIKRSFFSKHKFSALLATGLLFACYNVANGQHPDQSIDKQFKQNVDAVGAIKLPNNFATDWCHLGSIMAGDDIHNTYTTKDSLDYFRKNHKFEDGSILVKEVRASNHGHLTTGDAHWESGVKVWFVMMKDSKNRFPGNPLWGNGWGWSLYNGDNPNKQVATDFKKNCLQCHIPAQSTDWVYTDKYPLLADNPVKGSGSPKADQPAEKTAPMGQSNDSASDIAKGKEVFSTCASCHSAEPKKESIGPSLFGIVGRKAASEPGFDYSPAMKNSGIVWTPENIDKHLANVKGFIPGNYMAEQFPQGVRDDQDRAAVIDYLKTLK